MSDRFWLDLAGVLGLGVSAAAVCDMLLRWNIPWMQYGYMIYAFVIFAAIGFVLLSKKANTYYASLCQDKARLLGLRLAVSVVFFILGWYINAAMGSLYGKDSIEAAYNGVRVFAVSATMIAHVFYLAFYRKAQKG